jgi:hypothetical protein
MSETVPRFYFHFSDNRQTYRDDHGIEFATSEEAYIQATVAVQGMWRELLQDRTDPMACTFVITDAEDNLIFRLPFSELVERCQSPRLPAKSPSELILAIEGNHARATMAHDCLQSEMRQTRRSLDEMSILLRRIWAG